MTIFTLWFQDFPNNLPIILISSFVAIVFVGIFRKWFFGLLVQVWAVVFGVGLQLVPHEGASSPYGGLGLIAMFTGFFIAMGFIWSVIGE